VAECQSDLVDGSRFVASVFLHILGREFARSPRNEVGGFG